MNRISHFGENKMTLILEGNNCNSFIRKVLHIRLSFDLAINIRFIDSSFSYNLWKRNQQKLTNDKTNNNYDSCIKKNHSSIMIKIQCTVKGSHILTVIVFFPSGNPKFLNL